MMNPSLAVGMPSMQEMLPIVILLLLFFGAKRLPELARSLGQSLSEFKKGREDSSLPPGPSQAKDAPPQESKSGERPA